MDRFGEKVLCNPTVKLTKATKYPLIDIDKIIPGYKRVANQEVVEYSGQSGAKFEDGDILFARITPCLENGKMAIAKTDGQKGIGSTELFVFRGIDNMSVTDYVYYLLCMKHMRQLAANSERMAEHLYKEWFVRFRFPGHENAEFENGIPKGWAYTIVEDLSDVLQRGISPDYDDEGELTVISQKCIRQSIMDIKEARKQTKAFKPELNLCDGDTVICSTGTGTLGRVGQVYGTYPNTTFDSHVTLVRAKPTIGRHFLFWSIKSMQIWFMNMGIGSTNQQELYRNTIRKAKVIKPGYELINKFDSVIEPIHQEIIKLMKCQDNLIKQRDLLLPRLMSGKLEV